MFKHSSRYFVLVLTLVALTSTVRPAHAQPDDPTCTDPTTGCVVGSNDPPPPTGNTPPPDGDNGTNGSQSMNDAISSLMVLYGLA